MRPSPTNMATTNATGSNATATHALRRSCSAGLEGPTRSPVSLIMLCLHDSTYCLDAHLLADRRPGPMALLAPGHRPLCCTARHGQNQHLPQRQAAVAQERERQPVGVPDALDATLGRRDDVAEARAGQVGQLDALEVGPQRLDRVE